MGLNISEEVPPEDEDEDEENNLRVLSSFIVGRVDLCSPGGSFLYGCAGLLGTAGDGSVQRSQ